MTIFPEGKWELPRILSKRKWMKKIGMHSKRFALIIVVTL